MDAVRFSMVDEYLEELKAAAGEIENDLVRATIQYKTGDKVPITYVTVISTCVVVPPQFSSRHPGPRYLLKLEQRMGSYFEAGDRIDKTVLDATDDIIKKIRTHCQEHGLKCQPGVIVPGGGDTSAL